MRRRRRLSVVIAIALVGPAGGATVAGCGSNAARAPGATTTAAASDPAPRRAVVVGAGDASRTSGAATATTDPDAPATTAHQALDRFARTYINWTYRTLATSRAHLARSATGTAATDLQRAAAHSRDDYELQAGKLSNTGTILSISPLRGPEAQPNSWVVVTRERQHAAGTYDALPATYHVTIATVENIGGGWAVSRWEPQS